MAISDSRTQYEIFKFYLALYGFQKKGGSQDLFNKGAKALKRYKEIRNGIVKDILTPLAESKVPAFKTLPNKLSRALKGEMQSPSQIMALGDIFYDVCIYYKTHSTKIKEIEDKTSKDILKGCVSACFDNQVSLQLLLSTPPSRIKVPNKWIAVAAKELGEASPFEVSLNQMKMVEKISEEIRALDLKIKSDSTSDMEKVELLKIRDKKINSLQEASKEIDSSSPALALASSIINPSIEHRTDIGKEKNLSAEQEDAILTSGKVSIQAGAGSGKTVVVASKVAHTVKNLGVDPSKLMVLSTTKNTADNLREKIIRYAGSGSAGRFVGVPTESVAFSILNDAGVLADKKIITKETQSQWIKLSANLVSFGKGSVSAPDKPLVQVSKDSNPIAEGEEDPRLKPLLIKVVKMIAKKALDEKSEELLSLISPAIESSASGKIRFLDRKQNIWDDPDFRTSINNYISTSEGLRQLQKSEPFDGFKRFASKGALPKSVKVEDEWFNLGMDALFNSKSSTISKFQIFIAEQKKAMKSPSDLWSSRNDIQALDLETLKSNIDRDMNIAVYGAYEYLKETQDAIDQEDFSILASKTLIERPQLLKKMNNTYSHIMVDEAQGLSEADKKMLGLIAGAIDPKTLKTREDGSMVAKTYFLIGDEKQKETRKASPVKRKTLGVNFRSRVNIVEAANRMISKDAYACSPNPLKEGGEISYTIYDASMSPGSREIVQEIKSIVEVEGWSHDGGENHKFGIACRSSKEIPLYAVEMMMRSVPYSSTRDILKETPSQALLSLLGVKSTNPSEVSNSITSIHTFFNFNLPEDFNSKLSQEASGDNPYPFLSNGFSETFDRSEASYVEAYADFIKRIMEFDGTTKEVFDFLYTELLFPNGKNLNQNKLDLINQKEMEMLEDEIYGESVSLYEIGCFVQSGFDAIQRIFNDLDIGEGLKEVERLKKVSTMYSKEKDKDRVLIRLCKEWKGMECRDLYLPMSPIFFPRIGEDLDRERKIAYLAITRGQEKVRVLCSEYKSPFVDQACILSRQEFFLQSKEEKTPTPVRSASFINSMAKWVLENQ